MEVTITINPYSYEYKVKQGKNFVANKSIEGRSGFSGGSSGPGNPDRLLKVQDLVERCSKEIYKAIRKRPSKNTATGQTGSQG